ncbi:MAG: IS630 family transposase [Methylococcaceae bacterium]|nr:IS630 family transposase [Methylococcaceae bacterium]
MARTARSLSCTDAELGELQRLVQCATEPARLLIRAQIVLACLAGKRNDEVAAELGLGTGTVALWRRRFAAEGIDGLMDRPRPGKPPKYPAADLRRRLLALMAKPPPPGKAQWDGYSLANSLGVSADVVYRLLRDEHITLRKRHIWSIRTDSQFAAKSTDILGLFLSPPENALIISIDEKPFEPGAVRSSGRVVTSCGSLFRGLTNNLEPNEKIPLIAALSTASDTAQSKTRPRDKWPDVRQFLGVMVEESPPDREVHVILDGAPEHLRDDDWLAVYPHVLVHRTLGTASWLNQVEIWFRILKRRELRGRTSPSSEELTRAIDGFIRAFNEKSIPFVWRKDEEIGTHQQNRNADLSNF